MAKNILKDKTKIAKPTTRISTIVNDTVRIRNNEQARLRRLEQKYSETRNRADKKQLRNEIKSQASVVSKVQKDVAQIRSYKNDIGEYQDKLKSLKAKDSRVSKRLEKLYEAGEYTDEYKKLSNASIKSKAIIKSEQDKVGGILYKLNKKLGISPKDIVSKLDLSNNFIEKKLKKDLGEAYFEKEKEKRDEREEREEESDYNLEYSQVFWLVWRDFDKTESPRLTSYDRVTFVIDGTAYSYKGTSISLIHMKASDMWTIARAQGSLTYIAKYISVDGTKLKYIIE